MRCWPRTTPRSSARKPPSPRRRAKSPRSTQANRRSPANRFEPVDPRRTALSGEPSGAGPAVLSGTCQDLSANRNAAFTSNSPGSAHTAVSTKSRGADHFSKSRRRFPTLPSVGRVRPGLARARRIRCFCADPRAFRGASSATHPYTGSSIVYFCAGGPAVRDLLSQPLATRTGTSRSQSCRSFCLLGCSSHCARFCRFCW